MNRALWKKALHEAFLSLWAFAGILVAFCWIFVWLASTMKLAALANMLQWVPSFVFDLVGMPRELLQTQAGQMSMMFVDPVLIFTCVGWAVSRGSDSVSGEIGRGTMELVLAQPVRRTTHLLIQSIVSVLGAVVLALACLLGLWLGLQTVELEKELELDQFYPAVLNVFSMTFFVTGLTTFLSSWDSERWRTIGIASGVYLVALIIKMVARLWEDGKWLIYFTFLGAYEPHHLVVQTEEAWRLSLWYNGVFLGLGLVSFIAALLIFSRRDIPAPL